MEGQGGTVHSPGLVGFGCIKHIHVEPQCSSLHHGMALVYQLFVVGFFTSLESSNAYTRRRRKTKPGIILVDVTWLCPETTFVTCVLVFLGFAPYTRSVICSFGTKRYG